MEEFISQVDKERKRIVPFKNIIKRILNLLHSYEIKSEYEKWCSEIYELCKDKIDRTISGNNVSNL